MSNYVIGIGGSGARCVEALLYLSAAGLGPKRLRVVAVDPDHGNGNWSRAGEVMTAYQSLQSAPRGNSPFLRSRIEGSAVPWTPFTEPNQHNLSDLFGYNGLDASGARLLFDSLYNKEQREADLNIGFRGKPAIGAAVLAKQLDFAAPPWQPLIAAITADIGAGLVPKLFVFGSVFGGTGAAGTPTIARIISRAPGVQRLVTGCALLLPYFDFQKPANWDPNLQGPLHADSRTFPWQAKQALEYYGQHGTDYHCLYALGIDPLTSFETFSIGGGNQMNRAHIVDLLAALAALDFFGRPVPAAPEAPMIARSEAGVFSWQDLPGIPVEAGGSQPVRPLLGTMARMCFTYLKLFHPRLAEIWRSRSNGSSRSRLPWYVDAFVRHDLDISRNRDLQGRLQAQEDLAKHYLRWLRELNVEEPGFKVDLIDANAWSDAPPKGFDENRFRNMISGEPFGLTPTDIWRLMCDRRAFGGSELISDLGHFQQSLFEVCR